MVAETFDIVIRERGVDAIVQKIRAMGESAKNAQGSVLGLSSALEKLGKSFDGSKIIADLQKIATASTTAQNSLITLGSANTKTGNTFNQLNIQINQYSSSVTRATQINNTYNNSVNNVSSGVSLFSKSLALLTGAGLGTSQILGMSDAYTNLENRMKSVALNGEQANQMMQRTFQIANATQSPVEAVGTAFARYEKSLIPLGYSTQQVGDVTQTVASALKLAGATAGETGSVLKQLSQAFQKGKLDGDEFNSLSENFSGFGAALARALNIAPFGNFMQQIYDLKKEGKLTTEVVVQAITGMKSSIDEQMTGIQTTFGGSLEKLRNSAIQFFGELNNNVGIFDGLNNSISYVADNFNRFGSIAQSVLMGLSVTLIPIAIKAVIGLTTATYGLTTAMLSNPITAITVALGALVVVLSQTESGMTALKDTATFSFNAIYNVVVGVSSAIIGTWNGMINVLMYGLSVFSTNASQAVEQYKGKYLEMKNLTQGTSLGGKEAKPDGKKYWGADQKTIDYGKNINEAVRIYEALGQKKEADILLTKSQTVNEEANGEALKVIAKQSEINNRIIAQNALIEKQSGDAQAESTRRKIANLTKEATQIKNTAVQQKARNQLIEEEYQLSVSQLRGKKGFEQAKNGKEIDSLLTPEAKAKLRENAQTKTDQTLSDANSRLSLGSAIKAQNAKPKKPSTAKTEVDIYNEVTTAMNNNIKAMNEYGLAKQAQDKIDQISEKFMRARKALTPEMTKEIERLANAEVHRNAVYQETAKLYGIGKGQEEQFKIRLESINEAKQKDLITDQQKLELLKQLNVEQAKYNIEVGKGSQKDQNTITQGLISEVTGPQAYQNSMVNAQRQILQETQGANVELKAQQEALQRVRGNLTPDQYQQRKSALDNQGVQNRIADGTGSANDVASGALTQAFGDFKGVLPSITSDLGTFFTTMSSGIGDSVTKILTMQGGFEDLGNVARQALGQLIGSLVQLGIQWLITQAIGQTVGAGSTASTVVEAGIAASAWAPAAALASLATLGSNAVPAGAAITATTALSHASALTGFKTGGYTGNMGTSSVAGVVHGQEYVMNAQATRRNRPLLEAMNSGGSMGSGGGRMPNITVNNMGTPQNYAVESVTADEVRLIARDQAEQTVAKRTPRIVSSQIKNPNSEISKALGNNTKTQRRRAG